MIPRVRRLTWRTGLRHRRLAQGPMPDPSRSPDGDSHPVMAAPFLRGGLFIFDFYFFFLFPLFLAYPVPPVVRWSPGPLVLGSSGPLIFWSSDLLVL